MAKVLVSDYVHPKLISGLEGMGYTVEYLKDFSPTNLMEVIPGLTGIIINSKIKMTSKVLDAAKQLKFIGRLGSGLEIIDCPYAKQKGIHVFNSPEGNRNAVAEHALGMLLTLSNNLLQSDREVRQKIWNREKNRGFEIDGLSIGLIGFGNTGQAFAKKLRGFDVELAFNDPYLDPIPEEFSDLSRLSLEEIQETSDIISFHLPLTPETKGLVDENFFNQCKSDLIIINTSRGKVIQTESLLQGLDSGKIKGACLDVFENEKPQKYSEIEEIAYDKLFSMPNVVLSPHIAGWTHQSLERIATVLLDKISSIS